jgi:hypothetical protein
MALQAEDVHAPARVLTGDVVASRINVAGPWAATSTPAVHRCSPRGSCKVWPVSYEDWV